MNYYIQHWSRCSAYRTCVSRNCIWRYNNVYDVAKIPTDFILAPRSDWLSTGMFSKHARPYKLFLRKYLQTEEQNTMYSIDILYKSIN